MEFIFDWWNITGVLFLVIGVPIIVLAAWLHLRHSQYAHIPGPPRDSFWRGNVPYLHKELEKGKILSQVILETMNIYGTTIVIFFYHIPMVWTIDLEAIREILVVGEQRKSTFVFKKIEKLFGVSFFGKSIAAELDHELWSKHRKILHASFHRKNLKSMMVDLNLIADQLMNKLKTLADGKTPVAMHDEFALETQDAIGKVGFGQNIDSINNQESLLSSDQTTVLTAWTAQRKSPSISISPFKAKYRSIVRTSLTRMRGMFTDILGKRTKALAAGEHADDRDILSQIIRIKGSENMNNVLGFMLIQMGLHPHVLKRVKEEVDDILGSKDILEYEDIGKLKYTALVLKETMRLYPSVSQIFGESTKGCRIGKYMLPVGTMIVMSTYISGRCEEYYRDALEFKPERFLEKVDRNDVYSSFPFSVGPRNCIAKNYAKNQIFLILSKFLQKFDYTLDPNQSFELEECVTIRPKGHSTCFLTPRESKFKNTE